MGVRHVCAHHSVYAEGQLWVSLRMTSVSFETDSLAWSLPVSLCRQDSEPKGIFLVSAFLPGVTSVTHHSWLFLDELWGSNLGPVLSGQALQ